MYFLLPGLLSKYYTSLTSEVPRMAMTEFVVLTIGAFFQKVCFGAAPMYCGERMPLERDHTGVIDPLCLRC